jgi:hypothetical protein
VPKVRWNSEKLVTSTGEGSGVSTKPTAGVNGRLGVPEPGHTYPGTGPRRARPTNAAVLVLTPSMALRLLGISSMYTPGDRYSGMTSPHLRTTERIRCE